MKAAQVIQWGQPIQLKDVPQPIPQPTEVLVRVEAASLNPVDYFAVAGYMQAMLKLPFTPGTDFAGEVVSVGSAVTHVRPGDAVYGVLPMRYGAFAEFVTPNASQVALKPHSLDYAQAAAVPLVALTAWQNLIDAAQVQPGERVLIHGAAGNVGSFAVQLAKQREAYVIASNPPGKESFLQGLGADRIVDTEQFEQEAGQVDIVLNFASPDLLAGSYRLLKPGGRYVTSVGQPAQEEAQALGIRSVGVATKASVDQLTQIAQRIDAGKLRVYVQRTFRLEEAQAALDFQQSTQEPGKIVLEIA